VVHEDGSDEPPTAWYAVSIAVPTISFADPMAELY